MGGYSLLHTRSFSDAYETFVSNLAGGDVIWFIPCLILVELIYAVGRRIMNHMQCNISLIIISVVALFVTTHYTIGFNLWCWQTALFAVGFYAMGDVCKTCMLPTRKWAVLGFVVYIVLCLCIGTMGWLNGIDMHNHKYGEPLAFLVLSILGVYASVSVMRFLPCNRYLAEFGRYTLFMFPFHSIVLRNVLKVYDEYCAVSDITLMVLAVLTASLIMLFFVRYIYKYIPALGGKKQWI